MTKVMISYQKYIELYRLVSDEKLAMDIGSFEKKYKCIKPPSTHRVLTDHVELHFFSEEDATMFALRWL